MTNIIERFSHCLTAIEYPKEKTSWNIAGMIKGKNAFYRFDVREMFKMSDGTPAKSGRLDTKAQKMVFETKDKWLIFDIDELHQYIRKNKVDKVYIDNLLDCLEWSIILEK
tara:strand:+ start:249 stop:581 length:333 start_codon:yes stop_codon:yes gene_type:complete